MDQQTGNRRLAGNAVIVTGAGAGIGAASAHAFARDNADVVLVGRREDVLDQTAQGIHADGGTTLFLTGDVSCTEDVEHIVATTMERFGRLDFVFNNAGIQGDGGRITDMTEEAFDEIVAINL
jgi:NAD(P)-dependent dehydrogenase (short-subunit alcohol dehydrogenase family)